VCTGSCSAGLYSAHPLIVEAHGWSASMLQRMLWPALIVVPQEVETSSKCKSCQNPSHCLRYHWELRVSCNSPAKVNCTVSLKQRLVGAFSGHRDEVTVQFGEQYVRATWILSSNWSAISGQQNKLGEWDLLIGMCPISVDSKFGEVAS